MKNILLYIMFLFIFLMLFNQFKKNQIIIRGCGSSFSLPIIGYIFKDFNISYTPENSYAGIEKLLAGEIDFSLSEVYLTDEELEKNPDILHIPIGAVGINFAYHINIPGFLRYDTPIYLSPDILAKILLGKISKWNDPEIVKYNKEVLNNSNLIFPDLDIQVIHRTGKSGIVYVLSQFLTKSSVLWKKEKGITNEINQNVGFNPQALDMIKSLTQHTGTFSYTSMVYALQHKLAIARIENSSGKFTRGCSFRSAEAMKYAETRVDNRVDLTYPIESKEAAVATTFVYILLRKEQNYNDRSYKQALATVNFVNKLLTEKYQKKLDDILFSPLNKKFKKSAKDKLLELTYNGKVFFESLEEEE